MSLEYRDLISICNYRNYDFDDFLQVLGYKRISKGYNQRIIRSDIYKIHKLNELRDSINKALNHDKKIIIKETERINRNMQLSNSLKEIYDYRCQLCSDDTIPPIIMNSGHNYVEVHHIIPLCNEKQNDEENLDVLENMIVVCPYHHKYLHFFHGGLNKIIAFEDKLYFTNSSNDKIAIATNLHIVPTE